MIRKIARMYLVASLGALAISAVVVLCWAGWSLAGSWVGAAVPCGLVLFVTSIMVAVWLATPEGNK